MIDDLILGFDRALRTLSGIAASGRANPAAGMPEPVLTADERRHAAGLMRVNHTGEVCAQALYQAQALTARDGAIRRRLAHAAREEEEHLAWTQQRLAELNDRPSLVNPLWYAGSFAIGLAAGMTGDRTNLGFVVETERQVLGHSGLRGIVIRPGLVYGHGGSYDIPTLIGRARVRGRATTAGVFPTGSGRLSAGPA